MNDEPRWRLHGMVQGLRDRLRFERQAGEADIWRDCSDGQLCVVYADTASGDKDRYNWDFVGGRGAEESLCTNGDVPPHTPYLQCVLWELIAEDPTFYELHHGVELEGVL